MIRAPEPLTAVHHAQAFTCGRPALICGWKQRALRNQVSARHASMLSAMIHVLSVITPWPRVVLSPWKRRERSSGTLWKCPIRPWCSGTWPWTWSGRAGAWGRSAAGCRLAHWARGRRGRCPRPARACPERPRGQILSAAWVCRFTVETAVADAENTAFLKGVLPFS